MHKAGRITVLAVGGAARSSQLPDVPTFAELGLKEVDAKGNYALYAPAGTAAAAIDQWNDALRRVLNQPSVKGRLTVLGMEARASTPQEVSRTVQQAAAVWKPVIEASGFTVD
jgi:tripartite-type tricarboxylate transporter receptor subunit TctC